MISLRIPMQKQPTGNPRLMSLEQAQERFREEGIEIHRETLKNYLRSGQLRGRKQGHSPKAPWVIFSDSIEEYLRSLPHSPDRPK